MNNINMINIIIITFYINSKCYVTVWITALIILTHNNVLIIIMQWLKSGSAGKEMKQDVIRAHAQ